MELNNPTISFFINPDGTTIRFRDGDSRITFIEVTLTPEQLSSALSRLAETPCESVKVSQLDLIGKKLEVKTIVFEKPKIGDYKISADELRQLANEKGNVSGDDGWICQDLFQSQNTFFTDGNGKHFVRAVMRRWV